MGTRAFSHDSIFIPDGQDEDEQEAQTMSQDNILGKVKTLQQQLVKNIKFGQPPPTTVSGRRMQDTEEDGGSPSEPMEVLSQLEAALSDDDHKPGDSPHSVSPVSLPGAGLEEEAKGTPIKPARSKRPITGSSTIQSINLDAVPRAVARLDNSAAKHKLSVKPKNQRQSKKHKLAKHQHNLSLALDEEEITDKHQYEEQYPSKNRHISQAKHTIHVEIHAQSELAEGNEKERLHEKVREYEEERMKLNEEEKHFNLEEQIQKEEERRKQEERKCRELEEHRRQEEQRQNELEEKKRLEMAEQQLRLEERKAREEQRQKQLEKRIRLEEQRQRELEEQKRCELAEQQHLDEEQKRQEEEYRRQEDQRQRELEDQKRRELAEQQRLEEERKRQEEQKQKELEEQRRQEEQRQRELEQQRHRELAERQCLEEERRKEEELVQRQLEERRRLEEQQRHESEERKRRELAEQQRVEERKRQEELKQKELEERRRQEEQRQHDLEEQKLRELAEKKHREEEERKRQEEQKQLDESRRQEEQRQHRLEEQRCCEAEKRRQEEQRRQKIEEQKQELERQACLIKQQQTEHAHQEETEAMLTGSNERPPSDKKSNLHHKEKEQKERRGEELKWQEVDQRQTMPRPYTFQVSSGEKQIIFQKVNLSPVTPSKEPVHSSDTKEPKSPAQSKGSHALPSSMNVPHTAILVTGAQLCGTAVNLNQIKDTACKSLLGLTEERKTMDYPPQEYMHKVREHDIKPSKTKFTSEALDNQAMLAEWASIRSRILKSAENGASPKKDQRSLSRFSDDWTGKGKGDFHGNLRKTLSASAKFSITPAWQKFGETAHINANKEKTSPVKQAEAEKVESKDILSDSLTKEEVESMTITCEGNLHDKDTSIAEKHDTKGDNAEGCKFAKDLPSFLVPSPPQSPSKGLPQPDAAEASEGQLASSTRKPEKAGQNGEEKTSPFGIKLRRTNYSLRFHYDQQGEQKKKKRYSAGDSFDGVPTPLIKTDSEQETHSSSLQQFTSPHKESRDASASVSKDSSSDTLGDAGLPLLPPINSHTSSFSNEKRVPKSLAPQKPSLSPKPTSPTPPSSPLPRTDRLHISETVVLGVKKTEPDARGQVDDIIVGTRFPPLDQCKNEEEDMKEKKSFFPSINIPWREKVEKKSELGRKDKPVLQSRHSIDGSKLPEKVEAAQPLWITLALQKQKGFREQQATREERKQARDAKQAEKLAKENVGTSNQIDSRYSNISRSSTLPKSAAEESEKKMEAIVTRVERREQFKKSNTLPTSVTVEISDSIPSAPLVKDISKRFSAPDATPLSTEPAWLALAKRKAKAWSDCPQIIK